jgi:hypothetical protein
MSYFISHAKHCEDVILWRALQQVKNGFYIDIGANHPQGYSVTKAFYERGWYGINLEPTAQHPHPHFLQERPRDIHLSIAADAPEMRRLDDICHPHVDRPIHFLRMSAADLTGEILPGMDFTQGRPWIVVVEAMLPGSQISHLQEWEHLIIGHGYVLGLFDGVNRYYVAPEHRALLEVIQTPANALDHFITADLLQAREAAQTAQQQADHSAAHAWQLEQQILAMQTSLSWRFTAPLRWMNLRAQQVRRQVTRFPSRLWQGLRARATQGFLWLVRRERLRRAVLPHLAQFPALETRLQRRVAEIRQDPPPPTFSPAEAALPDPLRVLPASARKVFADLTRHHS